MSYEEASLHGSPIHSHGVEPAIAARSEQLERVLLRLSMMATHEAFFLPRMCFTIPRLLYLLRTSPCSSSPGVAQLDEVIKGALTTLCNLKLDTESWDQASLPVRWGGVGVRSVVALAPSAFISSMRALGSTVPTIFPAGPSKRQIQPSMKPSPSGRHWGARPLLQARTVLSRGRGTMECKPRGLLLDCCSAPTSLIALASAAPASGSWLNARPCTNLGLRLGNEELCLALGLRLGAPLSRASLYLRGRGGVWRS